MNEIEEPQTDLTESEKQQLETLVDPDGSAEGEIKLEQKSAYVVTCAIVQYLDCALFAKKLGLKPRNFPFPGQVEAVKAAYKFAAEGNMPSKDVFQLLSPIDEQFFLPIPEKDLLNIKRLLVKWAQDNLTKHALKKHLDEPDGINVQKLVSELTPIISIGTNGEQRRGYSVQELFGMPELEWIIENHIHGDDYACIYGASGECKTFVALDWALSLATGTPLYGKYSVNQKPVCYVISEGQAGFVKRVRAWLQNKQLDIPLPNQFLVVPFSFQLVNLDEAQQLAQLIRGAMPDVGAVFVDTLARNFGGNENETKDMNSFTDSVDWLRRELKTAVVVVHHSGKNQALGERGSYALRCAVNASFKVSKDGDIVTVDGKKQKDGKEVGYDLETVLIKDADSLVLKLTDNKPVTVTLQARVLNLLPALQEGEESLEATYTADDVAKEIAGDFADVSKVLKTLAEDSKSGVKRKRFGKGAASPYRYWIDPVYRLVQPL